MAITYVTLNCQQCGQEFKRKASLHKYLTKNPKRGIFCKLSCGLIYRHANLTEEQKLASKSVSGGLKYRNKPTELSPFSRMFNDAKRHAKIKNLEFNITKQYMKDVWDKQNGICPYSGWQLKVYALRREEPSLNQHKTSLDRIDPSKGYIIGNIQFVCWAAQVSKHNFSEQDFINFCKDVSKYRS